MISAAGDQFVWMVVGVGSRAFLLLLVAGALSWCLRRAAADARYVLWIAATAGLLVLPLLSAVLPAWTWDVLPAMSWPDRSGAPAVAGEMLLSPELSPGEASGVAPLVGAAVEPVGVLGTLAAIPWPVTVGLIWVAGVTVLLGWLGAGLIGAWRLRRASVACAEPWPALLDQERLRLGVCRPVRLLTSPRVGMPMTAGVWRPVIFIPTSSEGWAEDRRRVVLAHELIHIRRGDWLVRALSWVALSLHWFNPLAWWGVRRLAIERERACDEAVIAAGATPSEYAGHLLEIARTVGRRRAHPVVALGMARRSQLEDRLMSMLDGRRARRTRALAIPAAMLLAGTALGLGAIESPGAAHPEGAHAQDLQRRRDHLQELIAQLHRELRAIDARMVEHHGGHAGGPGQLLPPARLDMWSGHEAQEPQPSHGLHGGDGAGPGRLLPPARLDLLPGHGAQVPQPSHGLHEAPSQPRYTKALRQYDELAMGDAKAAQRDAQAVMDLLGAVDPEAGGAGVSPEHLAYLKALSALGAHGQHREHDLALLHEHLRRLSQAPLRENAHLADLARKSLENRARVEELHERLAQTHRLRDDAALAEQLTAVERETGARVDRVAEAEQRLAMLEQTLHELLDRTAGARTDEERQALRDRVAQARDEAAAMTESIERERRRLPEMRRHIEKLHRMRERVADPQHPGDAGARSDVDELQRRIEELYQHRMQIDESMRRTIDEDRWHELHTHLDEAGVDPEIGVHLQHLLALDRIYSLERAEGELRLKAEAGVQAEALRRGLEVLAVERGLSPATLQRLMDATGAFATANEFMRYRLPEDKPEGSR